MDKKTDSENIITFLNQNVFFREFTFSKTNFYPADGTKELADNVVWLDDIFIIFQIKERNTNHIKNTETENNWFADSVLKNAKKQIRNSIEYLHKYKDIPIKNEQGHVFNATEADYDKVNKIIIYMPNSNLLSTEYYNLKIIDSKSTGRIHVFHVDVYKRITELLFTPAEIAEYLQFRERFYLRHNTLINDINENYILAHFLNTDDERIINYEYGNTLSQFLSNENKFEMSKMIRDFADKIINSNDSVKYYTILKEIAKLNRFELLEFKKRITESFNHVRRDTFSKPYRFYTSRTECGFVFIPLQNKFRMQWENALNNFTSIYKYKRQLQKCIGVLIYKVNNYYEMFWTLHLYNWEFNNELEKALKNEYEYYGDGKLANIPRYREIRN